MGRKLGGSGVLRGRREGEMIRHEIDELRRDEHFLLLLLSFGKIKSWLSSPRSCCRVVSLLVHSWRKTKTVKTRLSRRRKGPSSPRAPRVFHPLLLSSSPCLWFYSPTMELRGLKASKRSISSLAKLSPRVQDLPASILFHRPGIA